MDVNRKPSAPNYTSAKPPVSSAFSKLSDPKPNQVQSICAAHIPT